MVPKRKTKLASDMEKAMPKGINARLLQTLDAVSHQPRIQTDREISLFGHNLRAEKRNQVRTGWMMPEDRNPPSLANNKGLQVLIGLK